MLRTLAVVLTALALPATATAAVRAPSCAVTNTNPLTVTYSGLTPGKGYYPYGRDAIEEITSTDTSEFNSGFGPDGAFFANRSGTHESHFTNPGVTVTFSIDILKERAPGPYEYQPEYRYYELPVSCVNQ
jgi:hypothetical protein